VTEPCPSPTGSHGGTVGVHAPRCGRASLSLSSGHGGIVTATILSGSPVSSLARNWNVVPRGMVRHTPGARSTVVGSSPSCCRHTYPAPPMMYQISWTVRWDTAVEISPASSWKCAKLPRLVIRHRGRTVDPSGAVTSGALSSVCVSGESSMSPIRFQGGMRAAGTVTSPSASYPSALGPGAQVRTPPCLTAAGPHRPPPPCRARGPPSQRAWAAASFSYPDHRLRRIEEGEA
jgi:hypothetical protein